ncbi:hypothetical protein AVEN_31272-1 [Araneus ventricosus]|uniref:Uncharacterized protein n=1 Tax=Araneus ventricosus TaxID=182803 RepID=A0A4Y2VED0_ARAVE|nr:hypothetical protein AVEN_31272-1 [Araneus ventricosus]
MATSNGIHLALIIPIGSFRLWLDGSIRRSGFRHISFAAMVGVSGTNSGQFAHNLQRCRGLVHRHSLVSMALNLERSRGPVPNHFVLLWRV